MNKYLIHLLSLETPEERRRYIKSLKSYEYESLISAVIEFQKTFIEMLLIGLLNYGAPDIRDTIKQIGEMLAI